MRSLENFQGLMQNSADLLVESVALSAKSGEYCDIHAMVGAMTVQVVGTTAFGCGDPCGVYMSPTHLSTYLSAVAMSAP